MKLQAGKKYITRRGDVIELKPFNENDVDGIYYSGIVEAYRSEKHIGHWDEDGVFLGGVIVPRSLKKTNGSDLIAEVKDK